MTDNPLQVSASLEVDEQAEKPPLDPREIEIRLEIADYVIRRVAGTPAGREIFDALISRYEDRFPHHKLLAHLLTCPGHLETDAEDHED